MTPGPAARVSGQSSIADWIADAVALSRGFFFALILLGFCLSGRGTARGGQRFIFDFGVKRCHVCKVDSVVAIGLDFDAAGAFAGIEPMGFETTRQAN